MALPIYGRVYEVLGQRKTFLIAYALYTVGCIVSYGIEPLQHMNCRDLTWLEVLRMNSLQSSLGDS
jgi:hypothetical protein